MRAMADVLSMTVNTLAVFHWRLWAGFLCLLLAAAPAQSQTRFLDPLETPADMRTAVAQRSLMAVAKAGDRLVAVGSRGVVIGSDDRGKTWVQAKVPVQNDLLSLHFPTPTEGWAVGHGGVVLHSVDGGKTWSKQLDGRVAAPAFKAFYSQPGAGAEAAAALAQLEQNYQAGPVLPFLDVWFEDAQRGYVVGSFGMIAATVDGGKTWEPWLHRIDNPQYLNLNAIRGIGGELYIVGERGQIYRLDRNKSRFVAANTGYLGSFFGIAGNGEVLIAFGLRGTTYRASQRGKSLWEPVQMPNEHTLTAGVALAESGQFALVNAAGQLLVGDKAGRHFRLVPTAKPARLTGIASFDGHTAFVTSLDGIKTETLGDAIAQP